MQIVVTPAGTIRCLYDEAIDLHSLGQPKISRGSYVEPDVQGRWLANLAPVNGPFLGPYDRRSEALRAEAVWLVANWLTRPR